MKRTRSYLTTHSLLPENQESPISFLSDGLIPKKYFFRRNHFPYPSLSPEMFQLPVGGCVERPICFSMTDLLSMPSKSLVVTLECSGNQRAHFRPRVYGEQWENGAVSQGVWTGVPLRCLLEEVGWKAEAKEVVFEGWDRGERTDQEGTVPFARSLPMEKAFHPDTLIAYAYNGRPIPYKHGYPLRLIVPQWYAMASVKWLKRIKVIDHSFQGPFQTIDYVYYPDMYSDAGNQPVTEIRVKSVIQQPKDLSILDTGTYQIQGLAWTGRGIICRVEISLDGGTGWSSAQICRNRDHIYSWTGWSYSWRVDQTGEYTILSRAWDTHGNCQPFEAEWNRKGYGYNAVASIRVKVE
jgi:DMSO/TMAO reductase YedYZ molybdopterin-dependent catalytic subunit